MLNGCGHTGVHPSVQAGILGAAVCGAVGKVAYGNRGAAVGAGVCGAGGAIMGAHLERKRVAAQQQEDNLNRQLALMRQSTKEIEQLNASLRREIAAIRARIDQQNLAYQEKSTNREQLRRALASYKVQRQSEHRKALSLLRQTDALLARLSRGDPNYQVKRAHLQRYRASLDAVIQQYRRIDALRV